jgi:hypothetical protein
MMAMSEADLPFTTISPAHLQGLCSELRILLDAELAAGNRRRGRRRYCSVSMKDEVKI